MIYFIMSIGTNFRNTIVIFLFCIYCPILKYFRLTGNVRMNIFPLYGGRENTKHFQTT